MKTIRSNKDIFLDKLRAKHDLSNYDFSEMVYANNKSSITFKCRTHGYITNHHPSNMVRSDSLCGECKSDAAKNMWLCKAIEIHGNRYSYDKAVLSHQNTPIEIVCSTHGSFWQSPYTHYKCKIGCPTCALDADKLDTSKFIQRAKKVFGDEYDYSKSVYTKWNEPITVTCPKHGDWVTRAGSHLSGCRCIACTIDDRRLGVDGFIKAARAVHGNKYDYSNVVYNHNKAKVTIGCPTHGSFKMKPNSHTSSRGGCPRCIESYGERAIDRKSVV